MKRHYTIGLDFGTSSVRALIVDVVNGREVGFGGCNYSHGNALNRRMSSLHEDETELVGS